MAQWLETKLDVDTHTHTLFLTLSFTHTHSLSHTHTFSLSLTHTLSLSPGEAPERGGVQPRSEDGGAQGAPLLCLRQRAPHRHLPTGPTGVPRS